MRNLHLSCLVLLIFIQCKSIPKDSEEELVINTEEQSFSKESHEMLTLTETENISYIQFMPEDVNTEEKWPFILFLHGAGERGDRLEMVTKNGPPLLAREGKLEKFIMLAPQCPEGDYWSTPKQVEKLIALIQHAKETLPIDPNRIYVTGLSMGGYGTWSLLAEIPNKIAAAAPICGGGDVSSVSKFYDKPIWAFHGDADSVVPVNLTTDMISAIEELGGKPKMTIYEGVGHDSWTQAYNTPELFTWLLAQRLE